MPDLALPPRWFDALLGCAIGDCLGLPFENKEPPPPGWQATAYEYRAPCWTDDTQQSLVLLDTWLRDGHLAPHVVMKRFVQMRDAGAGRPHYGLHRGTGRGFRHAVDRYAETGNFDPMSGRAGNGAAMRVAVVAYAMGESDAAREQLRAVSLATHEPGVAVDASIAVAEAAWSLGRGTRGHAVLSEVVTHLPACAVREALGSVIGQDQPLLALESFTAKPAGDGHALGSPLAAIVLAATETSLHAALRRAVLIGGDTDSTAAMTGALRAGVDGVADLPPALLTLPMAERLRLWTGPVPFPEALIDLERDLCALRRAV